MGIQMDKPPGEMRLDALTDCCMNEINKYRRGEAHDDTYCLEIFRRAIVQHDERAWEVLIVRFQDTVLGWLRRHPNSELVCQLESEQYFVDRTFTRFWRSTMHNQQLEFATLGAALYYLKTCLNCEILDRLRAQRRAREAPLPDVDFSEHAHWQEKEASRQEGNFAEPQVNEPDESSELWEAIESLLPNERERRVAYLLYYCNLKPREIVRYCPEEFSDVKEVYYLGRNISDRLMRNRDQLRWRLSDQEPES
jgi:DNA-directed RNA polymerase specialized sigma24 family protein